MKWLDGLKAKAKALKKEIVVLHLATTHPKTPWHAKALAIVVVGYAVSPIDLIPDFIPVLGLLDDLFLLPIGIAAVLKMIPKDVMAECRQKSEEMARRPESKTAMYVIIAIWAVLIGVIVFSIIRAVSR